MKHFLIQTGENGQVLHDFSFHLLEAIRFSEWKYRGLMYTHSFTTGGEAVPILIESGIPKEDIVPIGSLEFVFDRMKELGFDDVSKVTPLNVPTVFQQQGFLQRSYTPGLTKSEMKLEFPRFIKSTDVYKGITEIVASVEDLAHFSESERFDVSEVIDIKAEWRVFVQRDEVIGAKSYGSNDWFPEKPNTWLLKEMVNTIERARLDGLFFPTSYTLDVGVSLGNTFLIECHPFVSCGLYGFEDMERLPSMMIQGFDFFKEQAKNR
jgi:hypothetical protein